MNYSATELPYLKKTDNLLYSLQRFKELVALESSNFEHNNGRWSIISASPSDSISIHSNADFPAALRKLETLNALLPAIQSNLPFTGGLIGHTSYDLGIPNTNSSVELKFKDQPILICGLYTWAFVIDHKSRASYLVYWTDISQISKDDLLQIFTLSTSLENPSINDFKLSETFKPQWDRHTYKDKIDQIHNYIINGDTYQVNLAQRFKARFSGNPINAYSKLKHYSSVPFSTYFEFNDFSFASASPELFLSYKNNKITTKPIKGTLPKLQDAIEDKKQIERLLSSEKDRAENLMIVDLLRNDLSKHSSSVVTTKLFEVESFATVHHLVSTVEANIDKKDMLKQFFDAFPGGSITGAPKKRAMEIISELEGEPRSFYCGSSFYFSSNGNFNSNILIRSFLFENENVTCWAGGGIIHDSKWEAEYQESLDKVSRLMECIS